MTHDNDLLLGKIRAALYADSLIDLSLLHLDVMDEKVSVTGSVPSLAAFKAVENDILSVDGVKSVDNQLQIAYPGDQDNVVDSILRRQILSVLRDYPSFDHNVHIKVENGLVTLTGSVATDDSKERLRLLIKRIDSEVIVIDKVAVIPSNLDSDRSIARQIQSKLDGFDPINNCAIVIHVDNGNVIIDGKGQNWNQTDQIEFMISQIPGVKEVTNLMIIV